MTENTIVAPSLLGQKQISRHLLKDNGRLGPFPIQLCLKIIASSVGLYVVLKQ